MGADHTTQCRCHDHEQCVGPVDGTGNDEGECRDGISDCRDPVFKGIQFLNVFDTLNGQCSQGENALASPEEAAIDGDEKLEEKATLAMRLVIGLVNAEMCFGFNHDTADLFAEGKEGCRNQQQPGDELGKGLVGNRQQQ